MGRPKRGVGEVRTDPMPSQLVFDGCFLATAQIHRFS